MNKGNPMDKMTKQVVSMLVSSDKITLFTITGELIEIKNDEDYDTAKISEFLTPKLSGLGAVEITLNDFQRVTQILPADLEEHGIVVTQVINGQEIQGIFYPRKTAVQVTVGTDKVIIPDVENLTGHIKRAVAENSPSVANFLKRLAPVIQSRKHSGEDLMKFIKQSEMPLTNDGRIIAYKRVKDLAGEVGYYVDIHTKKVKQRVGSRVKMDVDLVDSSRHNSCSTGLHVANLGYMKGFSGTNTLIVLVNPEDFIAVPKGEDTKARVCSYEIIGVMSEQAHKDIDSTHVTNDQGLRALIKNAVEGNHFKPIEEVHVGLGGFVISTTPLTITLHETVKPVAVSSGKSLLTDKPDEPLAPQRDVMEVTRAAVKSTLEIPEEVKKAFDLLLSGVSKNQVADRLVTSTRSLGRWMEKYNFSAYAAPAATSVPHPMDYREAEEISQEDLETTADMAPAIISNLTQTEAPVSDEDFAKLVQSSEAPKITKADQMRKLYNGWVLGGFKEADLNAMKLFKSASKKSWYALGLTQKEENKIKDAE
jgi:hypothetical protein